MIAQKQYQDKNYAGFYNVGPDDRDCVTTGELADMFCQAWGEGLTWVNQLNGGPHESNFLKLDCSKIKSRFRWTSKWSVATAVEKTVEWVKAYKAGDDMLSCMEQQINEFLNRRDTICER